MMKTTSSTEIDPFREMSHAEEPNVSRTLDSVSDLSSYSIERLRNLLTSAIRKSTGKFSLLIITIRYDSLSSSEAYIL